ncbi:MAG: type II toxin-antitoxin system Phd/YefM family antitoxin [Thermodesulfobacteriota bacterium]|nr:type II toxin-antitoxin system Phd/YefM family antitoxin [Thermodesulfobacteriota bacterium]
MIQVNISEVKNRLSYYLRLVRAGEQIEILDRKTPLARIIHVSQTGNEKNETPWIGEMEHLGIVAPPQKRLFSEELLSKKKLIPKRDEVKPAVLEALLKERDTGR